MTLTTTERERLAGLLDEYAAGVQENLEDDLVPENYEDLPDDEIPSEQDTFPVVEDYQADATRIRMGEPPLHQHTWEILEDTFGVPALADDPREILALVERLRALDDEERVEDEATATEVRREVFGQ